MGKHYRGMQSFKAKHVIIAQVRTHLILTIQKYINVGVLKKLQIKSAPKQGHRLNSYTLEEWKKASGID